MLLVLVLLVATTEAWLSQPSVRISTSGLCMAKVKRGKLASNVERSSAISPDLAEYMAQKEGMSKPAPKKSGRRVRQSERQATDAAREEEMEGLVAQLESMLAEKSNNLQDILSLVRTIIGRDPGSLRPLTATKARRDYRLAWVGSDDAVCHVGTSLHKVPLARLQEVFLSFPGRNRVEIQEVIRVLGPFPNVKNTLNGESVIGKKPHYNELTVTWTSMVDGTGKELLAGTKNDVRVVPLHVYSSDATVIVAAVPPEDGAREDPLEDDGKHILVFVREDDLDAKLDALRVI